MLDNIIQFLSSDSISPLIILIVAFLFQYLENLFPPSPSDLILLFAGSLSGLGRVDFLSLFICSTIGSSLGFSTMFFFGKLLGEKIINQGKFKHLSNQNMEKVQKWFHHWGYLLIVINRFLSGTRAVISFFSGVAELSPVKSIIFASISAGLWNLIILYAGFSLGKNWQYAVQFIELYWRIVSILIISLLIIGIVYQIFKSKKH